MSAACGMRRHRGPGPKNPVTRADLPLWMRDALDAIDQGRQRTGVAAPPKSRRRAITSAVRDLVAAARRHGLAEEIGEKTVAAMTADARARGVADTSIEEKLSSVRSFARYCGRGVEWAEASARIDVRDARSVLASPAMLPYRDAAAALLADGVELSHIKLVGRWLDRSAERAGSIDSSDVEALVGHSKKKANILAITLYRLDPHHADLPLVQGWRRSVCGAARLQRGDSHPKRGRPRTVSVPVGSLPESMQDLLVDLAQPQDRRLQPWKPASIAILEKALCQIVHEARNAGAPESVCPETMKAWLTAIDGRDVGPRSKEMLLDSLARGGARAGLDDDEIDRLQREAEYWRKKALGLPKRKEKFLAERPLTLVDVADAARARIDEAPTLRRSDQRRAAWFDAAALALAIARPDREYDFSRYVVGETLWRTERGWESDLVSSKTNVEVAGAVWDAVGAYLDAGILLGAHPDHFWQLYRGRVGTAYFCTADGTAMAPGRVRAAFIRCLKIQSHLMRTLWFDEAAAWGDWGLMAARTLAGHRSVLTASHYETDVAARARISTVQDMLSVHTDAIRAERGSSSA